MPFSFSVRSAKRMQGINKRLERVLYEAIKYTPIDFGIPKLGGMRTVAEQSELYRQGKSKCDGVHTKSRHQSGDAIDFYAFVNGAASWDKVHLAVVAGVIIAEAKRQGLELRWGATFGSSSFDGWDFGHLEIVADGENG